MAVKVNPTLVLFGIATLVLATLTSIVAGEGLPRDCMLNQVKANSKNPHTFYWCLSDGPALFHCIDDLVFDTHAKKCITKQQQNQQRGRDKRGSKVTVTSSSSTSHAKQPQQERKPTAQAQQEKKPISQEPQDNKSTSPYYYSSLYPFPSKYIPSVPVAPVASQEDSPVYCPVPEYGRNAPLILIPSSDYCDEFYSCANGQPVLLRCPKDTDFNSKLKVCDNVRNVKCASGKRRRDLVKNDETAVPRVAPSSSSPSSPDPLTNSQKD